MATLTIDNTTIQRQHALDRANAARLGGSAIKRELKAGRLTLAQAVEDPRAGSLTLFDVLRALPRWGRIRALKVLREHLISESRKVRDLTPRQIEQLRQVIP